MGNLRYHGNHVYYHFQDQRGRQQKMSLKLKVEKIRTDPRGNEIFPAEAHELKRKIDRQVFTHTWGLDDAPDRLRLSEAFKKFIAAYENKNTVTVYTYAYNKLLHHFKDVDVDTIDEDSLIDWRKELIAKYKMATVEIVIRHMKVFFNYLEESGHVGRSPVTKRVKIPPVDSPIVIFSDKDLETLFSKLKESGYLGAYHQLQFLLLTGWRVSDSTDLTRDKVDFDRNVISHYIGKKSKTWEYPMDKSISKLLRRLPRDFEPYVFLYRDYHSLGKVFREICDDPKNGIRNSQDLSVHTLRKQFTFNCFRRGVPLEVCSRLLGHSSVKTTEKYYLYWDTQMLRDSLTMSRQATGKFQETFRKQKKL
jgi:integrase